MDTNFSRNEPTPPGPNDGLHLMLYAAVSALLPYVAATLLLLIGQGS